MAHRKWNKFFSDSGRYYILPHEELDKAIAAFKEAKALNILDIGSGTGRHLIELAANDFVATGVDFSPSAGQIAEDWLHEKKLTGKVYVGDFHTDLPSFGNNSFHGAIAINCLQYVDNKAMMEKILIDIHSILLPDSLLFAVIPSEHTLIFQPQVTQLILGAEELKDVFSQHFEILQMYQDNQKAWVIMGKNIKAN